MEPITVNRITTKRSLLYSDTPMVSVSIERPAMNSPLFRIGQKRINAHFDIAAKSTENYAIKKRYPEAVRIFLQSVRDGRKHFPSDILMSYKVTYNRTGIISLYIDRSDYDSSGETTVRHGISRHVKTGFPVTLSEITEKPERRTKEQIISLVLEEAHKMEADNSVRFFPNLPKLLKKYYSKDNFYLTESSLAFYCQSGDIAPQSAGILTFNIPFDRITSPESSLNMLVEPNPESSLSL